MTVLAQLKVVLGMDTGPFQTSAIKAQREAKTMAASIQTAGRNIAAAGVAIAGSAIAQQLYQMAKAGLEYASALGETAQQLGVTTNALQEYRYAATQVGLSSEEMDQALGQLTRRIGEAAQGTKAQAEAFKKLGISVKDTKGHVIDTGAAIPMIAEALRTVQSPAERAAILMDLFGKAGQKLEPLLADGAKGVNNLRDAAHSLGIVLTPQQIKKADDAADKFSKLKAVLDARISTVVADNADSIIEMVDALERMAAAAFKVYKEMKRLADTRVGQAVMTSLGYAYEYSPVGIVGKGLAQSADMIPPEGKSGGGRTVPPSKRTPTNGLWGKATYGAPPALSQRRNLTAAGGAFDFAPGLHPLLDLGAINQTRAAFVNLARVVTSPDMVDGIAAQMLRLDAVMVAPATKATKKTAEAFRKLAAEVQPLLDRLFPEARALNEWQADLATIDKARAGGVLDDAQAAEARRRLNKQAVQGTLDAGAGGFGDLVSGAFDKVKGSYAGFSDDMDEVRGKLIEANRNIGKSFTDMAQEAVRAIGTLGHAIKGGDFFDILDAVVGLGIQLGGMGLFGKSAAAAINGARIPGYAGGTRYHHGGMAIVGERGPELLTLPRGAQVTPNGGWGGGNGGGGPVHYHITGNLMTPEFWAQIQAGDQAAAQAGALGGERRLMLRQSRSLGR